MQNTQNIESQNILTSPGSMHKSCALVQLQLRILLHVNWVYAHAVSNPFLLLYYLWPNWPATLQLCPIHHIRLNATARADICWWCLFIEQWNSIHLLLPLPSIHLFSDTSESRGCGGFWNAKWLQLPWPQDWLQDDIATKELVPIIAVVAFWAHCRHNSAIRCHCDNMAVGH